MVLDPRSMLILLCLLSLLFLVQGGGFPFSEHELPFNRRIEITKNTNRRDVIVPFHFGPVGTEAWESAFVIFAEFNTIVFSAFDCFCAGDKFIMEIRSIDTPSVYRFRATNPTVNDCSLYTEDVSFCSNSPEYVSAFAQVTKGSIGGNMFNLTFNTWFSPYGGGIAYFSYRTYNS